MTNVRPDTSPSDPGAAPGEGLRAPVPAMSRPLTDATGPFGNAHARPRVKMLSTAGDLTPAGASYTPPSASPLPERGAGLQLFISVVAAFLAVTFLILLASKL